MEMIYNFRGNYKIMSCDFQSLYYGQDGYVVRCKECGHYQLAFVSTLITCSKADFRVLCEQVSYKAAQSYPHINKDAKIIMITTPCPDVHLILTPTELLRLNKVLEEADTEKKVQELMCLFR